MLQGERALLLHLHHEVSEVQCLQGVEFREGRNRHALHERNAQFFARSEALEKQENGLDILKVGFDEKLDRGDSSLLYEPLEPDVIQYFLRSTAVL
jgi:hypothetical protein